jgi:putative flippase GtrA
LNGLSAGMKYAMFAAAATAANLGIQRAVQQLCGGPFSLYVAMLLGTASGLVIKYLLDKHFIFHYRPAGPSDAARTFSLYLLMSGLSTVVFWIFELLFHLLFASPHARYVGAFIGLAIGYSLKYLLDRNLVFQRDRRRTCGGRGQQAAGLDGQLQPPTTAAGASRLQRWTANCSPQRLRPGPAGRGPGQPAVPFQGGNVMRKRTLQLLFFVVPGLFYFLTASRTPGWADATLIASNVVNLELGSWVNTHNLFHLLGFLWLKLFPPDNIHFYLLLLSAAFGTLTVYLVFLTGLELTTRPLAAALGALALMVSHSLWWHSAMLEVYTLNTALMTAMFYLVLRYNRTERLPYLYAAGFCFGLACSNHVLMGLFMLAFLVLVVHLIIRRKISIKRLPILLLCFLIGSGLYLFVFARDVASSYRYQPGEAGHSAVERGWNALTSTLHSATGGDFKRYMFPRELPSVQRRFWRFNYPFLLFANYPSPALLFGLLGLYLFWRRRRLRTTFLFFLSGIVAQAFWSANYFIWDMYAFSLPVYVLFSLPVILGIDWALGRGPGVRLVILLLAPALLLPVLLYPKVTDWYRRGNFIYRYFESYPEIHWARHTWDPVDYIANPNKRSFDAAERYVEKLYAVLPRNSHLLNSAGRSDYPLRYYYCGIYGMRADIVHHSLLTPLMTINKGKQEARRLKEALARGDPVYTCSLEFPEKVVLDQLYLLYHPEKDLCGLRALSEREYLCSFPGIRFEKIVLFEDEDIWIYRIARL